MLTSGQPANRPGRILFDHLFAIVPREIDIQLGVEKFALGIFHNTENFEFGPDVLCRLEGAE